jgi:hypothetical protein
MLSETLKQQETPLATRQLPAAQQPPPQHSDPMAQQWLPQETADTTRPSRQSSQAGAERSGPAQVKAPLTLRQVLHDPHVCRHSPQWSSVSRLVHVPPQTPLPALTGQHPSSAQASPGWQQPPGAAGHASAPGQQASLAIQAPFGHSWCVWVQQESS